MERQKDGKTERQKEKYVFSNLAAISFEYRLSCQKCWKKNFKLTGHARFSSQTFILLSTIKYLIEFDSLYMFLTSQDQNDFFLSYFMF